MTQDEHSAALPGHADFELPTTPPPKPLNGNRPGRRRVLPAANGHSPAQIEAAAPEAAPATVIDTVDIWDQRVARGLAFLRRRLAGAYQVDDFIHGHLTGQALSADRLAAAERAILDGIRRVRAAATQDQEHVQS